MGRTSKLTPEVQNRIVSMVRAGSFLEQAAISAGIHPGTYYRWMEKGERASSGAYRDFREAILRAEADAEQLLAATWYRCAVGAPAQYDAAGRMTRAEVPADPRAIRDLLRVRHPERWTPRDRVEVTGEVAHVAVGSPGELVAGARRRVLELVPGEAVA